MFFFKYTFECISNSITNLYSFECINNPAISKKLIIFLTSSSETYIVSSKVLMPVPETD